MCLKISPHSSVRYIKIISTSPIYKNYIQKKITYSSKLPPPPSRPFYYNIHLRNIHPKLFPNPPLKLKILLVPLSLKISRHIMLDRCKREKGMGTGKADGKGKKKKRKKK